MEKTDFNSQIERLCSQWPSSYGPERRAILYQAFKDVSTQTFTDAVTDCIANGRSAPLVSELQKSVELAKVRESQGRAAGIANFYGILQNASELNETADKTLVKERLNLLRDYLAKKITKQIFDEGCDFFDQVGNKITSSQKKKPQHGMIVSGRDRQYKE